MPLGALIGITRTELVELLSHVTLRNSMFPMTMEVEDGDNPTLVIDRAVIDRDAPSIDMKHAGTVRSRHPLPWARGSVVDTAQVVLWLRNRALREVLLHELDEWLHVDGERVFDPHADEDGADGARGDGR